MTDKSLTYINSISIRDPHDGSLLAQEILRPGEDRDSALTRIYRTTLGPDAPEQMVLSDSVWLDDREWADELSRKWGKYGLVLLAPKNNPGLENAHLRLVSIEPIADPSTMSFPTDRGEIEAIRSGRRHDAVVPVADGKTPRVGDVITFVEASADPFGNPVVVPGGTSVRVKLSTVRKSGHKWVGQELHYIAWDPNDFKKRPGERT